MKTLFLRHRTKLLALILIFSAVAYVVKRYKDPDCDAQQISFRGVDMKFPISVSDAQRDHGLIFAPYVGLRGAFNDVEEKSNGPLDYFTVMCPMSHSERFSETPVSSILGRQVNGYSFHLVLHGDSLRRKLETDFGGKFELKDNKQAIKAGVKWTTCYEMKVNECLYVATSNFGQGKSVNWITFTYGMDEAERAEFNH